MEDLIKRLEEATEPSRELDALIAASIQQVPGFDRDNGDRYRPDAFFIFDPEEDGAVSVYIYDGSHSRKVHKAAAPRYTASLDDAVPGEDIHMVTRVERGDGSRFWKAYASSGDEGIGNTEVLARRIASLKARGA